jgi:hypothetical protein
MEKLIGRTDIITAGFLYVLGVPVVQVLAKKFAIELDRRRRIKSSQASGQNEGQREEGIKSEEK